MLHDQRLLLTGARPCGNVGCVNAFVDSVYSWRSGAHGVSTWLLTGTAKAGEPLRVRGGELLEFREGKIVTKDSSWKIVGR